MNTFITTASVIFFLSCIAITFAMLVAPIFLLMENLVLSLTDHKPSVNSDADLGQRL